MANQDTDTAEGILTVGMSKGVVASSSVPPQQAPQPQQQQRLKVYQCIYIYIPLRKSVRKEVNYLSISLLSLRSGGSSRSSTRMKAGASTH